jgi:hypothetical protein
MVQSMKIGRQAHTKKQVGFQAASFAFDLAFDLRRPVKPPPGFQAVALLILILGAPLNHAGRTQALNRG